MTLLRWQCVSVDFHVALRVDLEPKPAHGNRMDTMPRAQSKVQQRCRVQTVALRFLQTRKDLAKGEPAVGRDFQQTHELPLDLVEPLGPLPNGRQGAVGVHAKRLGVAEGVLESVLPQGAPARVIRNHQIARHGIKSLDRVGLVDDVGVRHHARMYAQPIVCPFQGTNHVGFGPARVVKPL